MTDFLVCVAGVLVKGLAVSVLVAGCMAIYFVESRVENL
jgi:hypothetical protein